MPWRALNRNVGWKWGFILLLWTLVGCSFAAQFYFSSAQFGHPVSWPRALTFALSDWYVFALLSLPALRLARRFPLEPPALWRNITVHLLASGVFSLGYMVLRAWVGQWESAEPMAFSAAFNPLLVKTFHFNVLVYWVVVSLVGGLEYYRKFRERELRAAELEKRLAEAKLQALQMQLNPHFLFNTLNTIAALMHKDVEAADRMIVRLGELLRCALEAADTQEVPLRSELDFLSRYLEIEQTRFGSRLEVSLDVAPDTLDALVPNLILQPIVENAIRHGVQPHATKGRIVLTTRREGEKLRLTVQDNGGGMSAQQPVREGVGLTNTRERLRHLYGEAERLRFQNVPGGGGLAVEIEIPFHSAVSVGQGSSGSKRS